MTATITKREREIFDAFVVAFNDMAQLAHENAIAKGWWDEGDRNKAEVIALMHSELSEALEAERAGNPSSEKIPTFSGVEEEYGDVIIRIMDDCARRRLAIAPAIVAKHIYNKGRAYKHGGKKF